MTKDLVGVQLGTFNLKREQYASTEEFMDRIDVNFKPKWEKLMN